MPAEWPVRKKKLCNKIVINDEITVRKGLKRLIQFKKATKIYDNGAKGLDDVSFNIQKGEFVFVVGSSGSGKSTLVRLILKEVDLTLGEIIVDEKSLSDVTYKEIPYYRRKIGVVFQDFRLLPNKTVYENVSFAMEIVGSSYREIRRHVPAMLGMVGLQRKARAFPSQISGGEQQRAALARAIINKPPILLADEPTGNLDPETSRDIMSILGEVNATGTTVVMATHAKDIVDDMRKRVISLKNGVAIRDEAEGGYYDED